MKSYFADLQFSSLFWRDTPIILFSFGRLPPPPPPYPPLPIQTRSPQILPPPHPQHNLSLRIIYDEQMRSGPPNWKQQY